MKYIILFAISFLLFKPSTAQVKFRLYRENPCRDTSVLDSTDYYIRSLTGETYKPSSASSGVVLLPGKGEYYLYINNNFEWLDFSEPVIEKIEIKDTAYFYFKYREESLRAWVAGTDGYKLYHICNLLADGYQEDFYFNNIIRIRGSFKKGAPKDSLVTFYENGRTKRRILYLKRELFIKDYDSLSNLISVSHNSNNSIYLTNYKTIKYFTNGNIKLREKYFNGVKSIEEHFAGGNLKIRQGKWKRIEYFENAHKKLIYKWKRRKAEFSERRKHRHDFIVQMQEFDADSKLIRTATFEEWNAFGKQPNLGIEQSDWIVKLATFNNGVETSRIEDMGTKKYLTGKQKS